MGAVENIKEVADLVKKFNDIELNRRILNLENEVIDLSRDKRRAEDKVEELEKALKFKGELTFRDPYYFVEGDPSAYCPGCWDSKRMAVHIVTIKEPLKYDQQQCPSCKHFYDKGLIPNRR
jgi:hypothetical protein